MLTFTSREADNFVIRNTRTQMTQRKPSPPFITSTLQQTVSNVLGISPQQCMSIAQATI